MHRNFIKLSACILFMPGGAIYCTALQTTVATLRGTVTDPKRRGRAGGDGQSHADRDGRDANE